MYAQSFPQCLGGPRNVGDGLDAAARLPTPVSALSVQWYT